MHLWLEIKFKPHQLREHIFCNGSFKSLWPFCVQLPRSTVHTHIHVRGHPPILLQTVAGSRPDIRRTSEKRASEQSWWWWWKVSLEEAAMNFTQSYYGSWAAGLKRVFTRRRKVSGLRWGRAAGSETSWRCRCWGRCCYWSWAGRVKVGPKTNNKKTKQFFGIFDPHPVSESRAECWCPQGRL